MKNSMLKSKAPRSNEAGNGAAAGAATVIGKGAGAASATEESGALTTGGSAEASGDAADEDEDWAVYELSSGVFSHYAHVCPAHELPAKNGKIGIRDIPVGLMTSGSTN